MSRNMKSVEPIINRLVVIGLGLIGSSLAVAARDRGLVSQIIGLSRRQSTLEIAQSGGIIDQSAQSLEEITPKLGEGDMVVIAVPTLSVALVLEDCISKLSKQVTVTDVASVKGSVVETARQLFGAVPAQLVPGHPIAGSEKSGVTAANGNLFEKHRVILTPTDETGDEHLGRVISLWQGTGATVSTMTVKEHDQILAATSHLPHFLAYSLVDTLAGLNEKTDIFRYAAGGFRDFTRIAASDPVMWRDIALANKASIITVMDRVMEDFKVMRGAIERGDKQYLSSLFTRARDARNHFGNILESQNHDCSVENPVSEKSIDYVVSAGGDARGDLRVPGDKSISHRSIMLGSLAEGMTEVSGFLEGEDSLATLQAFRDMGVDIEGPNEGRVVIHGVGLNGLKAPKKPLYLGNSGTSMRLLAGLMAGQDFDVELQGDHSLSARPMGRVAKPLRQMGALIESDNETPPLCIKGGKSLSAIAYQMPVASAQVKSCLLLAGLYASGKTSVEEPAPTRDHTERMLRGFGYKVKTEGGTVSLSGGGSLKANRIDVPADISSAAFFMVAAAIVPESDITLRHVGVNPTRIGIINILRQMGTTIDLSNEIEVGGEPVADIRIQYAPLKGIQIPESQVPLAIDEFPVLFIAAACAKGTTLLTGAEELRVKESDRIQSMADGLVTLGIDAQATPDGMRIEGGQIGTGEVSSFDDHRIAMAFAIAGLRAKGPIRIKETSNVATSFPDFVSLARQIGLDIAVVESQ